MKILLASNRRGDMEVIFDSDSKELVIRDYDVKANTEPREARFEFNRILQTLIRHGIKVSSMIE